MNELRQTILVRNANIHQYLPPVVGKAAEFKEYCRIVEESLTAIIDKAKERTLDTFVLDFDLYGCKRWEDMLDIVPPLDSTLDDRRSVILGRINATLPYTERKFQQMLDGKYGKGSVIATLDYDKYLLTLEIKNEMIGDANNLRNYARYIIPANLTLEIINKKFAEETDFAGAYTSTHGEFIIQAEDE